MSDERSFERFVADHVAGAGVQVRMPDEFYDDIHAFASRTQQRPEWLALIKEPPMRIDSRLGVGSPIARMAIILATTLLMAALGVGALIAGAQSPDASLPPPDPIPAVHVTGTLGDVDVAADGSKATARTVTSSDSRLGGVFSAIGNRVEYPGDVIVVASRVEFRDDHGAWLGTGTGYTVEEDLDTLVLAGEGAYEGLTAYLILDWGTPGRPFTGVILPGEMPEPPPAP